MDSYTIERIGDDNVIRLSDDDLARHGLKVGDRVEATLRSGSKRPTVVEAAREGMKRYEGALARLAK